MKMKLELDGRKVVNQDIKKSSEKVVQFIEFDDGTTLNITQTAEKFDIDSNKKFEIMPDGKTVRFID